MAWWMLIGAGLLEVVWAVGLKQTHGFTRLWPTVITVAAMVVSMGLLGLAARTLPIGVAYAVWTGIGTVGTAVIAFTVLGEQATVSRVVCIGLIVAGIVGLKVMTPPSATSAAGGGGGAGAPPAGATGEAGG